MNPKIVGALLASLLLVATPASGQPRYKELGTDPALDAPPALDLTSLSVARDGEILDIRIAVENMLPVVGGYESLPGVWWVFDAGPRTFGAEAYIEAAAPQFLLFELVDGEPISTTAIEGTYEWTDGFISMHVPLTAIGAITGTRISGADDDEGSDADSHVHLFVTDEDFDVLATTKSYRVP